MPATFGTVAAGTLIDVVAGNKRIVIVKYTGNTSYATGGDAVPAGVLGIGSVDWVGVIGVPTAALGWEIQWNGSKTAPKMQWLYPQGGSLATPVGAGTATPATGGTAVTSTAAQPAIPVDAITAREAQAALNLSAYSAWLFIVGA